MRGYIIICDIIIEFTNLLHLFNAVKLKKKTKNEKQRIKKTIKSDFQKQLRKN